MEYFFNDELHFFTQSTADAISSVLNMQVCIVDAYAKRLAGTECFSASSNKSLTTAFIFTSGISNGKSCLIENPGLTTYCLHCPEKSTCKERAILLVPVTLDGKVIASIGLSARTGEEKIRLLLNINNYTHFTEKMADLLVGKVKSELSIQKAILQTKNLESIIATFTDGILFINTNHILTFFNKSAEVILRIQLKDIIGKDYHTILNCPIFEDALTIPMSIENLKSSIVVNHISTPVIMSIFTIVQTNNIQGIVVFFQNISSTKKKCESTLMPNTPYTFDHIQGESQGIKQCITMAKRVSSASSTILILGESGTGKELFARAIHNESSRKNHSFLAINCSAIPDNLLESELFGYEGGAFTGAKKEGHPGKFELANGGTIFLDEIGDMPLTLQAKLLRVLQNRTIERVGSSTMIAINVRIIAATNKDLEDMISKNLFRQDLYYRINVIPITIPPLRDRIDDISISADYLLKKHALILMKDITTFTPEVLTILLSHDWPGNVRELENAIEYAINMEIDNQISTASLPPYLIQGGKSLNSNGPMNWPNHAYKKSLKNCSRESEYTRILNALSMFENTTNGKIKCADYLNISISTLYRKLRVPI